jgi:uncharacterized membrane protein YoaK (UPF0700 family)
MLTLFTEFMTSGANFMVGAALGENLQNLIKSIIGPVFLAIVGVISLNFLIQRQIMQFVIFILIAVLVAALIYVPDMIKGLGEGAGSEISW